MSDSHTSHSDMGSATISPSTPVRAGSWGTWTITYKVPSGGIDDGGSLRVAIRFASDWATPQMNDPAGDHYLKVSSSRSDTQLVSSWRERAHIRPYQPHLFIEVLDAPLESGDEITIVFGDRSSGGKGTRAQTFVQDEFDFQIVVDCLGTGVYESLKEHPSLEIIPQPAPPLGSPRYGRWVRNSSRQGAGTRGGYLG